MAVQPFPRATLHIVVGALVFGVGPMAYGKLHGMEADRSKVQMVISGQDSSGGGEVLYTV